jgi:hypothetical protein
MSEGLDRDLPMVERASLRAHYVICRGCRALAERLAFLRRATKKLADGGGA